MKAALLLSPEKLEIKDVPTPVPGPGEVLINTELMGICGTDISFYSGHRIVPYPFILGHELMGRIQAVGEGVSTLRAGQRVIVEPNYPCGSCRLCLAGRGAVCPEKLSMGVNIPGCFSEYALAPAKFTWPIPESISDEDAATIEPLTVSAHGFRISGLKAGESAAVLGCGVVGLLMVHAAASAGVRVIAYDRIEEKRKMAAALGAEVISDSGDIQKIWEDAQVSTVFECAGATATVELALQLAPRGAQVILLGISASPASFIPMRLVREGIDVRTSMIYDHPADFDYVIGMVAKEKLKPSRIVTHSYSFNEIDRALALAVSGKAGKVLIRMK